MLDAKTPASNGRVKCDGIKYAAVVADVTNPRININEVWLLEVEANANRGKVPKYTARRY